MYKQSLKNTVLQRCEPIFKKSKLDADSSPHPTFGLTTATTGQWTDAQWVNDKYQHDCMMILYRTLEK